MALNPDAAFDQSVLEMIEHSPVGAVPRTPAYQDALTRLRGSQQVYPDADHRDGYVTARSIAGRPCHVATNLAALVAGTIDAAELETNVSVFNRYVAGLPPALVPKAESLRQKIAGRTTHHRIHAGVIARDPVFTLFLVPGTGRNLGIVGNYLYGYLLQREVDPAAGWAVHLHDADDGAMLFDAPTLQAAFDKLQEVLASVPFHLSELEGLGFRSN